ncbi:MAG: MBL fold metallo-hydrolase [Chloroflexi bacterium]|nr:MBL fold metallo-hydrolase [Chloroflexota bacterium]
MKIEYLGHAAFRITNKDGVSIVTDPYEPGGYDGAVGYGKPSEPADIVTVSHEHEDHNYAAAVPGSPEVVKGPGRHKVKGVEINGVATFHDDKEGAERGPNTVMCFKFDGINVCHAGDLGHQPNRLQRSAIGPVDVLFLPVGGLFTVDPAGASQVLEALKPKVVIPMHFKTPKCGFPLAKPEDFLAGKVNVKKTGGSQIELSKESLPASTQVIFLNPAL